MKRVRSPKSKRGRSPGSAATQFPNENQAAAKHGGYASAPYLRAPVTGPLPSFLPRGQRHALCTARDDLVRGLQALPQYSPAMALALEGLVRAWLIGQLLGLHQQTHPPATCEGAAGYTRLQYQWARELRTWLQQWGLTPLSAGRLPAAGGEPLAAWRSEVSKETTQSSGTKGAEFGT